MNRRARVEELLGAKAEPGVTTARNREDRRALAKGLVKKGAGRRVMTDLLRRMPPGQELIARGR